MSQLSSVENQPKRFAHTCRSCNGRYNVLIHVEIQRVHQAACPHCGQKNYFDNRGGRLATVARQQAGAPGKVSAAGAPSPPPPAAREASSPSVTRRSGQASARREQAAPGAQRVAGSGVVREYPPKPATKSFTRPSILRPGQRGRAGVPHWIPAWLREHLTDLRRPGGAGEVLEILRGRYLLLLGSLAVAGCAAIVLGWITLQFPVLYLGESPAIYMQRLEVLRPNQVLDRNGELIAELFSERTGSLSTETMPLDLAQALVFTEDSHFYSHGGVYWPSVFRALVANVFSGGYSQGGSTITQQLARILLNDREKSIFRKLRELSLAYELESSLTKDQILIAYMNHVYLGHGARGFEIAARFYFDRSVDDLTFEERLALVCLPSAPERYSPVRNPDQLARKMDAVFARMQDQGFPTPDADRHRAAVNRMLRSQAKSPGESVFGNRVNEAPYVSEYIRQKVVQLLGKSYEYGQGLKIYTTIDRELQMAADRASREFVREKAGAFSPARMKDGRRVPPDDLREQLLREYGDMGIGPALFGIPAPTRARPKLQTASIGIETRTGRVVFMQGGTDFTSGNQLNRAIQMRRQTGSAIKPFVYSAGIESGAITTGTLLDDRPIFVPMRGIAREREKDYWLPGNYSGVFEGEILVRRALERSQNIPAIRIANAVGIERLSEQFRKFFFYRERDFERRFRRDSTVAIGSLEMSPLEIATAFTAFGNNGKIRRPFLIQRVTDANDRELWSAASNYDEFDLGVPLEREVLPGDVAEVMVSLLGSSAKFGGVARGGFSSPHLIGKTGTSNEYRDAWFVGSTPDITTAVWMGFDEPAFSMPGGTGAGLAGPLWGRIMKAAPPVQERYEFAPRAVRVEICKSTGRRATASCPVKTEELFISAHLPEDPLPVDASTPAVDSGRTTTTGGNAHGPPGDSSTDFSINSDSDFD